MGPMSRTSTESRSPWDPSAPPRPDRPLAAGGLRISIDARPRGPDGLIAEAPLFGRPMLEHLIELAEAVAERDDKEPIAIHARVEEQEYLHQLMQGWSARRVALRFGPPSERSIILRADRVYDPKRLRGAVRRGRSPETAVVWRLDTPHGLAEAEAELARRRSYQPIGRFWAVPLSRLLVRCLAPTRVRPHTLTILGFLFMLAAAAVVAWDDRAPALCWTASGLLASAFLLDISDGRLARRQGTASPLGRWLDTTLDETGEMVLHAAIACAAFWRTGLPIWLGLGMIYGMSKYLFVLSNDEWDRAHRNAGPNDHQTPGPNAAPAETLSEPSRGAEAAIERASGRSAWRSSARPGHSRSESALSGHQKRLGFGWPGSRWRDPSAWALWTADFIPFVQAGGRAFGHADVRWHLWMVLAALGRLDWALAAFAVYYPVRTVVAAGFKVARHG